MVDGLPVVIQGVELVGSVPLQILEVSVLSKPIEKSMEGLQRELGKTRPERDTHHSYSQFIG